MKAFRWCVLAAVMLAALPLRAACTWPAWEQFKKDYISEGGRVIDPSDTRKITTSEGQSYALFFALAANDRKAFDLLLTWTRDNLASGDLNAHLPAWLWGQKDKDAWAVIDNNSASDADVWIAWSLVEAGRLWKDRDYTRTGKALLKRIVSEEVVNVPGLGAMLLPGKVGFAACCLRVRRKVFRRTGCSIRKTKAGGYSRRKRWWAATTPSACISGWA